MLTVERLLLISAPIVAYWASSLVFALIGRTSVGRRSTLQPGGWSESQKQRVSPAFVLAVVAMQHAVQLSLNILLEFVQGTAAHPIEPLPPWPKVLLQIAGIMLVSDTWLYWTHRFLHINRWLYVNVHAWHHSIEAPYSFSASFNHPLEGLLLDTTSGALSLLVIGPHPYVAAAVFVATMVKTCDDHCGMALKWDPLQAIFENNSRFHDLHHEPRGMRFNFSQPWFSFWDDVMGTRMPPDAAARRKGTPQLA